MSAQDPQACTGRTDGYAELPPCICGDPFTSHELNARKPYGRSFCCYANPNPCPCKVYVPSEVSP
jgi:hypothetical protein